MHPILFKIGALTFYTHGLLAVLGIVVGTAIIWHYAFKSKLDRTFLFDQIVFITLVGIIGARITYFVIYRDQFASLKEILYLWDGGMVSYGGFIFGFLALIMLLKSAKQPILRWLDVYAVGFTAGLIFGRLGNMFAGEYSGKATLSRFNLAGVYPVTLMETGLLALILVVLILETRKKFSEGLIFTTFAFLYGLGRFIIDFWRDEKVLFFHISLGQLVSLLILLMSVSYYFVFLRKKKG